MLMMGDYQDGKILGANRGPTWVLSTSGGPHIDRINIAIRVGSAGNYGILLTAPAAPYYWPFGTKPRNYEAPWFIYMTVQIIYRAS